MTWTSRTPRRVAVLIGAVAVMLAPAGAASAQSAPAAPSTSNTQPNWEKPAPKVTVTQPAPATVKPTTAPAAPRQATPNATGPAVPIIIDTDIFGSADDAGALAVANAMQDNGQVNILGIVVNYPSVYGATAADAIDAYYGHNIPIGIVQPTTTEVASPNEYAQYLTQNFAHPNVSDGSTAPDAVTLYRQILAAQPDHSVVIVAIGLETNLANLLNSPGDANSPLTGADLVAAKVKSMVMMGGQFPSSGSPGEYNWVADASSATQVVNGWTLPAEYEGYEVGQNVLTGAGLAQTPDTNPVKVAYTRMVGANTSMSSWDPVNMYYAGLGLNGLFTEGPAGSPVVNSDGSNTWDSNSGKGQHYLVESASPDTIASNVEQLMDQLPGSSDPIAAHYKALGGSTGYLGAAVGNEYATTNGGKAQDYQNGTIYWSQSSGAWAVRGAIWQHYKQLGGPAALGYPLSDEQTTPDGTGRYNHFNASFGASIYWTQATGAHEIKGAIRDRWASEGWERGVAGYPATDETGTPDGTGRYNHFSASDGASIYWTPSTGAHEIQGAIRSKWASMGWETGPVGYPKTDETGTPDGIGRYNHFSRSDGASIYWSPSSGANAIYGAIRGTWAQLGWERSRLGYPTTDEYGVNGGRRNDFLGGWIVYSFGSGTTQVGYN